MDVELVVCSSSGKPIFRYATRSPDQQADSSADGDASAAASSFASSLQGLLSFAACTQGGKLQELEIAHCRCVFRTVGDLTLAAIERRDGQQVTEFVPRECLARVLRLLRAQILLVLSDRGLDVLRKQPGYDLRELLGGTERVMSALADRWRSQPALRLQHFGLSFVRLAPDLRKDIARAIAFEPDVGDATEAAASSMICGVLFARERVVAVAQPNKKQFSIQIDDLLLLSNFVFHAPSLVNSETWTPVCLPHFNPRGFLHAYVVFLSQDLCLLLLSSEQSPDQFPRFQAKKQFITQRLSDLGAIEAIDRSVRQFATWKPHADLPLMRHFVFKNELTGECAAPALDFPFDESDEDGKVLLLNQYAKLHHLMFPAKLQVDSESQVLGARMPNLQTTVASRMVFERSDHGLFFAVCSDDYRLVAVFDALATITDARDQIHVLLERLKRDDELVSVSSFAQSVGFGAASSLWP